MLVGLPGQTVETISSTIDEVIRLKPDRVALAYLAYITTNFYLINKLPYIKITKLRLQSVSTKPQPQTQSGVKL